MTRPQRLSRWIGLGTAIAVCISLTALPEPVQAQWWNPGSWFGQRNNRGALKGNRTGAAHRSGSCPKVAIPLTALAPLYQIATDETAVIGTTASDRPILWFYVPYDIGGNISAQLWQRERDPQAIATSEDLYIEREILTLPVMPAGLVGIQLPNTEASLKVDTVYHWFLTVQCNPNDASTTKFVDVSLVRVAPTPSLPSAIAAAPPRQQLDTYMQRGLWNEAITILNQARCATPTDPALVREWSKVMREIGLTELTNVSGIKCAIVR